MSENNIKDMKFEEAMERLEKIVRFLESGNAGLDESIAAFEEGISLVKLCNSKLEHAEQRVKILMSGESGELTEADFNEQLYRVTDKNGCRAH